MSPVSCPRFLLLSLLMVSAMACTVDDLPPYQEGGAGQLNEPGLDMFRPQVEDLSGTNDAGVDLSTPGVRDMTPVERDMVMTPILCEAGTLQCGQVCAVCPEGTLPSSWRCAKDNTCVAGECEAGFQGCDAGCCPTDAPKMWGIVDQASDDSEGGTEPKALLDDRGFLHLMYVSGERNTRLLRVKYAVWNGSRWEVEYVPEVGGPNVVPTFSFALDSSYRPHVVAGSRDIVYFTWNEQGVVTKEFPSRKDTFFPTIQLDSQDEPHVVYGSDRGIFMHSLKNGRWDESLISSKKGRSYYSMLKFAIDPADTFFVAFHERLEPQTQVLTRTGGVWSAQNLTPSNGRPVTSPTALRAGAGRGGPALVLQQFDPDKGYDTFQLVRREISGNWSAEEIDIPELQAVVRQRAGVGLSLDVDRQGDVHLSYEVQQRPDGMRQTVYHAQERDGPWVVEEVETVGTPNRGGTQVRVDQAGRPWVVYGLSDQRVRSGLNVAGKVKGRWETRSP